MPGEALAASVFSSRRISVTVHGSGPDVVMIPGLGSAPSICQSAIAAVPGYRYHLVQVKGFAGTAAEANASGPILEPVAKDIVRYITAMDLRRPRLIGHSMGGTRSEEHTSELQSLMRISYAVFCLKKKRKQK